MSDQRKPKDPIKTKLPKLDENAVEEIPLDELEEVAGGGGGDCFGTNCAPQTDGKCWEHTCQTTAKEALEG